LATRGSTISFGNYALKATESGFITSRQLEAARKAIVRYMKKGGKLWIRIFPDKPYTKKALEVPMG
jgi:large subunit ribosomal protein L16